MALTDPSLWALLPHAKVPVLGFAAPSGTGKTTLLCRLIPILRARGLILGLIKHAHHDFDLDQPGKDSFELRKAGASKVLITSSRRRAMVTDHASPMEPRLDQELRHLDQEGLNLILVEGFKREAYPKLELHRAALTTPFQYPSDTSILALITDMPPLDGLAIPCININDPEAIADFIMTRFLPEAERAIHLR